jgi:hypothetical protein
MADSVAQIAKKIAGALKGYRASAFYVWDELPVQPGDAFFLIQGASADGERLDLALTDERGKHKTTLSVFAPVKVAAGEQGLRIEQAARVTWGDFSATPGKGPALRIQ